VSAENGAFAASAEPDPECGNPRPSAPASPFSGLLSAVIPRSFFWQAMGAAIYLALVGGGLVAAFAITVVLRGVKLI